ncbi:GDSL-type esterase/lipase family protein [Sphingomonas sp.]|uniref:GDSL-type esterase/lipase family protein n=1 Tax=Sphingomonas sp. TaxID=28214 RepID=UPI001B2230FB|nr:GDSL-type esterase/lipase family protein [Sphingomonas sp.]MBO9711722.1 GDSL family lipase [Sphingomonas sp.]
MAMLATGLVLCTQARAQTVPDPAAEAQPGRPLAAVNGTTLRCPPPPVQSAEQRAAQFETRPRDLDEMSKMAKAFMDPTNPAGAPFRKRQEEQRATDWPFLCRYREANAALKESGKPVSVVFMGDSITEGWIGAHPDFFARHGYVDRGISGQSSSQMVARFQADVIALRPRVVHIMTGTNDIGGATGPITEDEFVGNVSAMIDLAKANGIEVVLASIPPMSRLLPRPEFDVRPVVVQLNRRLRALAAARGVTYVDYYTPLVDASGAFDPHFANDGVHPTRAGYSVMEPLAEKALERAVGEWRPRRRLR